MEGEVISIRIDPELVEQIKEEARKRSFVENKDVSYSDVIRASLNELYNAKKEDEPKRSQHHFIEESDYEAFMKMFNDNRTRGEINKKIEEKLSYVMHHESLANYLFLYDKLPMNHITKYERPPDTVVGVISLRGAVPDIIAKGDVVMCPTFEIACNPGIPMRDIEENDVSLFNACIDKGAQSLLQEESRNILALLDEIVKHTQEIRQRSLPHFFKFEKESDNPRPKVLLAHPSHYNQLRDIALSYNDKSFIIRENDSENIMSVGKCYHLGHIQGIKILLDSACPEKEVFVIYDKPDDTGVKVVRQDATIFFMPEIKRLRFGFVIFEEVGFMGLGSAIKRLDL